MATLDVAHQVPSACPLDCPDTCSLSVGINAARDRVVSVDGDHRSALTNGVICGKVRKLADHLYCDERLAKPLIRVAPKQLAPPADHAAAYGQFREATWDEALDLVEAKMRAAIAASGAQSIVPYHYGGSNGWLTEGAMATRFWRRLGSTQCLRTLCAMPTGVAAEGLYGSAPGMAIEDMEHSRFIVLWGINPSATGIHAVPVIERAMARGAKLVVIDPRRIPLAARATHHLAPLPGTDLPLALGMANYLFEQGLVDHAFLAAHVNGVEAFRQRATLWPLARAAAVTGVSEEAIAAVATGLATTRPAVVRCGYGQERNRNGGSATAAILALPALVGAFGQRGGGYLMSNGKADWGVNAEGGIAEPAPSPDTVRQLNMVKLGEALATWHQPPVRVLFNYNCNALATAPDQEAVRRGLANPDVFVVVHDQIMTDTAHYADVVLPATSFMEHRDIRRGYGNMRMFDSAPAVTPFGESRTNNQVFGELLARFNLVKPGDPTTDQAIKDAIFAAVPRGAELAQALARDGIAAPTPSNPIFFVDAFPNTASGKVELVPAALDAKAPGGLYHYRTAADVNADAEAYPFTLISPALSTQITSTFGQLRQGLVPVLISPTDAAALALADGAEVTLENQHGTMRARCNISPDVRPGVLVSPKGLWAKHTLNGRTSNALVPATLTDLGAGACYNDARVRIVGTGILGT